jgi:nucleoside 2-deoxyribosyltransferase
MKVFNALEKIAASVGHSFFLAGSVSRHSTANWREYVMTAFADTDFVFYNPERSDWDENWKETVSDKKFAAQVQWEMDAMEKADTIIINFLPGSPSAVTMMEMGLFAASGKLMVCCPDDFWKCGNVQMVCQKFQVPFFRTMDGLIDSIKNRITNKMTL